LVRVQLLRRVLELLRRVLELVMGPTLLALDLVQGLVGIVTGTARTAEIAGEAVIVTANATATVSCVLAGPARPALTSVFLRA
jgi:hypothetical protein